MSGRGEASGIGSPIGGVMDRLLDAKRDEVSHHIRGRNTHRGPDQGKGHAAMTDHTRHGLDVAAFGGSTAAVFKWLPDGLNEIAALLSIIWLSIQIGAWIYRRFRK